MYALWSRARSTSAIMAMDTFFMDVSHHQPHECGSYIQRLREHDPEAQQEAAVELRRCVERAVKDLSTEQFEEFERVVHQRVFKLLNEKVKCVELHGDGPHAIVLAGSFSDRCLDPRFHRSCLGNQDSRCTWLQAKLMTRTVAIEEYT